jgi:hypothetical protein
LPRATGRLGQPTPLRARRLARKFRKNPDKTNAKVLDFELEVYAPRMEVRNADPWSVRAGIGATPQIHGDDFQRQTGARSLPQPS